MTKRWTRRPDGSNWGDFGEDDQVGRLNLLKSSHVRAAMAEVREGIRFCLSMPLDRPGGNVLSPSRFPPFLRPTMRDGISRINYPAARHEPGAIDIINDDAAILHTQYSTHWDSLAHVGFLFDADADGVPEIRYYNGFDSSDLEGPVSPDGGGVLGIKEAVTTARAKALGIENMAQTCVQGRGVMIDLAAHLGTQRRLVGYETLMGILDADKIVVEEADFVCFHTGFTDILLLQKTAPTVAQAETIGVALDGHDRKLQDWITQTKLVALVADNFSVEAYAPVGVFAPRPAWPLHEHCIFRLGIHLGELWHLTPLAKWLRANNRSRFLLTAPPLWLPGAIGSPTTPIATV